MSARRAGGFGLAVVLSLSCSGETSAPLQVEESPAGTVRVTRRETPRLPVSGRAGEPFVYASQGGVTVSWLETADGMASLRFTRFEDGAWSAPRTVASGSDFFVNWADVPSVVPLGNGSFVAHWLRKSGEGTYSYDVVLALSGDDGATWREIGSPHETTVDSEYGFASIESDGTGGAWIAWLDGREMSGHHGSEGGSMHARAARLRSDGTLTDHVLLDERTCECCQTGMAMVGGQPVVVWRDRSETEVRDAVLSWRGSDGSWSEPAKVHDDQWTIPGCPVNGPQISADGDHVVVASFTAADDRPIVKVAFSQDGGRTFGAPIDVSDAAPLGRVDVLARGSSGIITWLEQSGDRGTVNAAVVGPGGVTQRVELGTTSAARTSGFPRAALDGDTIWVAWTVPGDDAGSSTIEIARLDVSEGE